MRDITPLSRGDPPGKRGKRQSSYLRCSLLKEPERMIWSEQQRCERASCRGGPKLGNRTGGSQSPDFSHPIFGKPEIAIWSDSGRFYNACGGVIDKFADLSCQHYALEFFQFHFSEPEIMIRPHLQMIGLTGIMFSSRGGRLKIRDPSFPCFPRGRDERARDARPVPHHSAPRCPGRGGLAHR